MVQDQTQDESSEEDGEDYSAKMEAKGISSKERGTLKSGIQALETLKAAGFDERDAAKQEFMALYHTFTNFTIDAKKTQSDSLYEYLGLMEQIIDYVATPQFKNFFREFDKKLHKNVIKRCAVLPLSERVLTTVKPGVDEEVKDEPTIHLRVVVDGMESEAEKVATLARLESILCKLVSNDDKIITDTLAERLEAGLQQYLLNFGQQTENRLLYEQFIERVEDQRAGGLPNDKQVSSKGGPRKGLPGKRSEEPTRKNSSRKK